MLSTGTALIYTLVLGAAIFFCRALPFIFFRNDPADDPPRRGHTPAPSAGFVEFVEKVAPPVAMTVLAVNSLAGPVKEAGVDFSAGDPALFLPLIAAVCTAALHIWKRNALVSIFGGTALYMILRGFFG
ncbi:MAG: AzlD domain-containing protein [Spirochaetaceae bacterium]|jgi:branched-subunit amino acid transport protein AzlD|nr:AzlD domain-containing protein [Spirochaetaceae bacterium]